MLALHEPGVLAVLLVGGLLAGAALGSLVGVALRRWKQRPRPYRWRPHGSA